MTHARPDPDPDPEFVARLEWQVRTGLRRRERFAVASPSGLRRAARTAVLCALCLVTGAGAVVAAERLQQDHERARHLERARLELELCELRLEWARDAAAKAQELASAGALDAASLREALGRARALEHAAQRARLDRAESEASGLAPSDDVAAPLVAGRDFVGERLELDQRAAQEEIELRRALLAEREQLARAGVVAAPELDEARTALAAAEAEARLPTELRDLRARALAGELPPAAARAGERAARLEADIRRAEATWEGRYLRLERSRALGRLGLVSEGVVRQEELALEQLEREIELLRLRRYGQQAEQR